MTNLRRSMLLLAATIVAASPVSSQVPKPSVITPEKLRTNLFIIADDSMGGGVTQLVYNATILIGNADNRPALNGPRGDPRTAGSSSYFRAGSWSFPSWSRMRSTSARSAPRSPSIRSSDLSRP